MFQPSVWWWLGFRKHPQSWRTVWDLVLWGPYWTASRRSWVCDLMSWDTQRWTMGKLRYLDMFKGKHGNNPWKKKTQFFLQPNPRLRGLFLWIAHDWSWLVMIGDWLRIVAGDCWLIFDRLWLLIDSWCLLILVYMCFMYDVCWCLLMFVDVCWCLLMLRSWWSVGVCSLFQLSVPADRRVDEAAAGAERSEEIRRATKPDGIGGWIVGSTWRPIVYHTGWSFGGLKPKFTMVLTGDCS